MNAQQAAALKEVINMLAETIRECPHAVPKGILYVGLLAHMPSLTAQQFADLITLLEAMHPDIESLHNDCIQVKGR